MLPANPRFLTGNILPDAGMVLLEQLTETGRKYDDQEAAGTTAEGKVHL